MIGAIPIIYYNITDFECVILCVVTYISKTNPWESPIQVPLLHTWGVLISLKAEFLDAN